MSNSVFPSLPGLAPEVERQTIYKTTVHETVSGKEVRTSWQSTPRYRYKLKYNALLDAVNAPSPYQAYSQKGAILWFLDQHVGAFDSFLFTDPISNTQVRVRFETDSLAVKQIVQGAWSCEFSLISVK